MKEGSKGKRDVPKRRHSSVVNRNQKSLVLLCYTNEPRALDHGAGGTQQPFSYGAWTDDQTLPPFQARTHLPFHSIDAANPPGGLLKNRNGYKKPVHAGPKTSELGVQDKVLGHPHRVEAVGMSGHHVAAPLIRLKGAVDDAFVVVEPAGEGACSKIEPRAGAPAVVEEEEQEEGWGADQGGHEKERKGAAHKEQQNHNGDMHMFKASVLVHVFITWGVCWLDQSAPYFPIEISRTATGRIGKYYFPLGFLVPAFLLWIESTSWIQLLPAPGVLLAACVNDELHWPTHLLGVLLMVCGVIAKVAYDVRLEVPGADQGVLLVILASFFIFLGLLLKAGAVLESWEDLKDPKGIAERCMEMNYTGCGSREQLVVYKVTGLCQWVALALLINTQ